MTTTLVIDPITRIEGHGKVTIEVDDDHNVVDAKLHVVEFRGYEKFIQGHPFWEAPILMQRICGICFVSHHLAGAKVLDDIVGVGPASGSVPDADCLVDAPARPLRADAAIACHRLLLPRASGDAVWYRRSTEQRNVLGLIEADPELVKRVVMLRKWGQEMLVAVFGKRMHGISSVPGGVNNSLTAADVDRFLRGADGLPSVDRVIEDAQLGLELFYDFHEKHRSEVDRFAYVPALNMCLVDADGNADYYDGKLRIVDDDKNVVREFDHHDYLDHFSEGVEKWSYMKFPFLTELGWDAGSVRVGPLARMNVTHTLSTPLAQQALEKFHAYTGGRANNMTLHTNWARAIEIIHAAEVVRDLLLDPDLQKDELVVTPPAEAWTGEGIGVVEAPRGSLLHHYRADREGNVTFANLIVATTQNNQVLNRTVRSVAEDYLGGQAEIIEGMMNAIEVGIRAYDPCLSCATHALGQMPLIVSIVDAAGHVINERVR